MQRKKYSVLHYTYFVAEAHKIDKTLAPLSLASRVNG